MESGKKLYKIDTKGKVRVWWMDYDDEKYRACSGLIDGAIVESGWQYPTEKNIGKVNATSFAEQVLSEVNSKYEARMYQGKYHPSIEESRKGAKFIECMLADKFNPKKTNEYPYFSQVRLASIDAKYVLSKVLHTICQTRTSKEESPSLIVATLQTQQ